MTLKATFIGLTAAAAMAAPAFAEYPDRTIELTIPAGAGGGTDTSARKLALLLEEKLGTSIAILNVGGGGGSVGASQFMQAKPDGYALFATWNSPLTTVPQVQDVAYSLDSFTPIASTSETAYTLCVKTDFPRPPVPNSWPSSKPIPASTPMAMTASAAPCNWQPSVSSRPRASTPLPFLWRRG